MPSSRRSFTAEFKREAVQMIQKQGLSVAEPPRRLDLHKNVLRKWARQFDAEGEQAFPGKGQQTAIEEENRRLREEVRRLTMERDILKKSGRVLREGVEVRYSLIDEHRHQWPVSVQCRVLQVSRSGLSAWRRRAESVTAQRPADLTEQIRCVHQASRQAYGSPRVHAELVAQGHR